MRLTKRKTVYPRCDKQGNLTKVDCIEIENKKLAEEKLCQLEDIEEELGIDLITLFKALKNGIYYKEELTNKYVHLESFDLMIQAGAIQPKYKILLLVSLPLYFKDYGKTWALTKEELE